jgi:hypothetical protein
MNWDFALNCPGKLVKAVPYPLIGFLPRGCDQKISRSQIMIRFFPLYQSPFDEGFDKARRGALFHGEKRMQLGHPQSSPRCKGVENEKLGKGNIFAKDVVLAAAPYSLAQIGN